MSYFDDYVADGLCCECCGVFLDDEPGFVRRCYSCQSPEDKPLRVRQSKPKKPRHD